MLRRALISLVVVAAVCLAAVLVWGRPPAPLVTTFNDSPAGWMAYDYEGGKGREAGNVFYPATWQPGLICADDSMWRIDTPEDPDSILALLTYRSWVGAEPLDLRGRTLVVRLKGEGLDLHGAHLTLWVHSTKYGTRYHAAPALPIEDEWSEARVPLAGMHRSWSHAREATEAEVLSAVDSYGIAFVGFDAEVTGRVCLDEVRIE
jgi:hypothetical protein